MRRRTDEQNCTLSTRVPTEQEAISLQQMRANLVEKGDDNLDEVCPHLIGRLVFEPWTGFDAEVQETRRIAKEELGNDESALQNIQTALQREWIAVEKKPLSSYYDVKCLFSSVFDVVNPMIQILNKQAPVLACADRIILPPHGVPKPHGLQAWNCVMINGKDWDTRIPCLCVTSIRPIRSLYDWRKSMGPLQPRRAQKVSEMWNFVLSKETDSADLEIAQHQLGILNAVTEALYSHSGCAVLWNYRSIIAVRIVCPVGDRKSDLNKVCVQVSGMYTDTQGESPTYALIAALQIAVNSILISSMSEISRFSAEILSKNTPCVVRTTPDHFSQGPSKWVSQSLNEFGDDETICTKDFCWISARTGALFESECGKRNDEFPLADAFFEHVLTKYSRVMYTAEDISMLLFGTMGNVRTVTKYANINMSDGSEMLHSEAGIYNYLRKEHAELLGDCVPDLLGIRMKPFYAPVIVLEYVGQSVTRREGESAKVGGASISEVDWFQIITAANRGLEALANAGVYQHDQTIANIRAERMVQSASGEQKEKREGEGEWRVWWIDLGLAEKCEGIRKPKDKWYETIPFNSDSLCTYSRERVCN